MQQSRSHVVGALMMVLSNSVSVATDAIKSYPVSTPLARVLVEASEPRYVAPTLRDRIGRIWAPVYLNGKGPFRLVFDTGANSSAVVHSVVASLGLPHEERKVTLHGITGSAIVPVIAVDSIEVGDLSIEGARMPVVSDVFGGAEGVLGMKGLGDKRVFIDFRNDQIQISRSHGTPVAPGFTRVPVNLSRGQLITLEIRVGSIRTMAVLDTGAQQTIGNNSLREALMRRPRDEKDTTIVGVTLDVADGTSIPVPPIALGTIKIRNMRVTFGDMFIFDQWDMEKEPAMLIGMDVIGSLDTLIIDYKLSELHMRARR